MTNRSRRRKSNRIIPTLIILVVLAFFVPAMTSLSKYVYHGVQNYYLGTKGFYFNSDKLSSNHSEFEIANNWSGAETYTITVNLNSKKNDLLFTETDIDYTINYTYSDNIDCTISKNSGTIVGTTNGGINEDYFVITIDPKDGTALANGEVTWVEIEVKSTSPYVATLSGKLIVEVGAADISYEIIDESNNQYLEVNIVNSLSNSKDVTLAFDPEIILLDMTSNFRLKSTSISTVQLNGYAYVKSVTSNVGSLETTTVKFYKRDSTQDYTYQAGDTGTPVITLTY
jgi:hypothetical protein